MTAPILEFKGPYRFLSNFYPVYVAWWDQNEEIYPTVEHAYQAAKFLDPDIRASIQILPTPGQAKRRANRLRRLQRPHEAWDAIKLLVMWNLLCQKFSNSDLREMLLATGDAELIEGNTWGDIYWGQCNGVGQNWLGKLLMGMRSAIREKRDLGFPSSL